MLDENELWLMSYYRASEIAGAELFGRLARSLGPGPIQRDLTKHFADEAAHAWYWTACIDEQGGQPLKVRDSYQSQYLAAAGMPVNLMEVLAISHVFERRAIRQYSLHRQIAGLTAATRATLDRIMVDEKWHLRWIHDALKGLEHEYTKEAIEATLGRFAAADHVVYQQTMAEHEQRLSHFLAAR
jgi:hypothetical protein